MKPKIIKTEEEYTQALARVESLMNAKNSSSAPTPRSQTFGSPI